jgi:hypothetical protein
LIVGASEEVAFVHWALGGFLGCVSSSLFSAFVVRSFKCCMLACIQCFCLRSFSMIANFLTRSPVHLYRMISNISRSFPILINLLAEDDMQKVHL